MDLSQLRELIADPQKLADAREKIENLTPRDQRLEALRKLKAGHVRAVFTVDLFNEGVDVPTVDTLLFLRPTDSPTLFLQQLGRGLRKAHRKTVCTVLDFV